MPSTWLGAMNEFTVTLRDLGDAVREEMRVPMERLARSASTVDDRIEDFKYRARRGERRVRVVRIG